MQDNPLKAIKSIIEINDPIIFDVGANQGQTIDSIRNVFPKSSIHSFEPSKVCFKLLKDKYGGIDNIKVNNVAVGAEKGILEFNEYSWSALNSLLKRAFTKAEIVDNYNVDVISLDDYCIKNSINSINLLKTDTEGYELNVLKGAFKLMDNNKIQYVYVEVFFYENYINQSSFGDIYNFLIQKGFNLVRFYDFEYTEEGFASRTDALFFNPNF